MTYIAQPKNKYYFEPFNESKIKDASGSTASVTLHHSFSEIEIRKMLDTVKGIMVVLSVDNSRASFLVSCIYDTGDVISEIEGKLRQKIKPLTWEEKAKWLQEKGYPVAIDALSPDSNSKEKWRASIQGEGARYGETIASVVSKVYETVATK